MTDAATATIPFVDLQAQRNRLGNRIDAAIRRVIDHGEFVMGPEVAQLEEQLAAYSGARHAVTCSSGTDALLLALLAHGVGPGDAVVVPAFTFPATPGAVALLGATPVFADVRADTCNIDLASVGRALDAARRVGLRPRAVVTVDLFGQPADYDALEPLCRELGLVLVADAAQSFGATWRDRRVGTIGDLSCTSFFPSKPLGCYGDGGAVLTDDDEVAATLRSLRVHGQGSGKYDVARIGINGRLDTMQAAVLLEKLSIFDDELVARRRVAARYDAGLAGSVTLPGCDPRAVSAWAQYTIQAPDRDGLAGALADRGVPTAIHYPRPLHRQRAYAGMPTAGALPAAEALAERVLSIPMHPYLDEFTQDRVADAVVEAATPRS